jgi:excisionase family DNA binding protein
MTDNAEMKLVFSVGEVAEVLGIGTTSTKELIHTGELRSIKIGRLTILERWQTEQAHQRAEAGAAWSTVGLVVTTAIGTPLDFYLVPQALKRLCDQVGVSPAVSPYELRHTAITFQAEAGHTAWVTADWAGTSERMIADVYRHKLTDASPLGPAI